MSAIDPQVISAFVEYVGKDELMVSPSTRGSVTIDTAVWAEQAIRNLQSSFIAEGIEFNDSELEMFTLMAVRDLSGSAA
ncbi:MAG: hypothetical protein K6L74_13190 [Neptuniibacter sp.]